MRRLTLSCIASLLIACASVTDPAPELSAPALQAIVDCSELEESLRQDAIAEMEAKVDEQLPRYLDSARCPPPYTPPYPNYSPYPSGVGASAPSAGASLPSASAPPTDTGASSPSSPSPAPVAAERANADSDTGSPSEPSEVSGTNNQVAGVDEADIVKSDGRYLYLTRGQALRILEAWPAEELHEVSRTPLPGSAKNLFVLGDRALIYVAEPPGGAPGAARPTRACTYGYDCDFTGDGTRTRLVLLDISDRAEPRVLREIAASGSLIAARRIGGAVHTVVSDGAIRFDGLRYAPTLSYCNPTDADRNAEVRAAFAELKRANAELINRTDVLAQLPSLTDSRAGEAGAATTCSDYFRTNAGVGASFLTLFSFDLAREEPLHAASIVSRPGAVYASEQSLYIAVRDVWSHQSSRSSGARETSSVHRFSIGTDPLHTRYEASGRLRGHVLNQFAMDEWNGDLRVASSLGRVPDPDVTSMVSVLRRSGAALRLTGSVRDIAPQEDIRSVRFDGPRGFIVTFKKTDPLFVLDLAKPEAPALLGELKIPGFSTYMHMLDEQHLLTIGYDADDQGSFAYFQGVLLQIFDVSDPREPKLAHKEVIGTRGSSSEALTNHLAFNYFAAKGLLSFPITICEGGGAGAFGSNMTFSGLIVYDVDTEHGFRERGRVAHPSDPALGGYNSAGCSNWWTRASSVVKRSVIMDDYVYSIADNAVRVQDLNALGEDVASVLLQGP